MSEPARGRGSREESFSLKITSPTTVINKYCVLRGPHVDDLA